MNNPHFTYCMGNGAPVCATCKRSEPVPPEVDDPWYCLPEAKGESCPSFTPKPQKEPEQC